MKPINALRMRTPGGSGGTWTPASLTSPPVLWFNASSAVTLVGSDVDQWNDVSGNGYHATRASALARPAYNATGLNGKPTLTFSAAASDGMFILAAGALALFKNAGAAAVFAVYKNLSSQTSAKYLFFASTPSANNARLAMQVANTGATNKPGLRVRRLDADSATILDAATSTGTAWGMAAARMDWTNGDGFVDVNGVLGDASNLSLTSTGSTSNTDCNRILIGQGPTGTEMDCEVAELFAVTAMPTTTELDKINGYFAHQWALTGVLDVSHPYKSAAP